MMINAKRETQVKGKVFVSHPRTEANILVLCFSNSPQSRKFFYVERKTRSLKKKIDNNPPIIKLFRIKVKDNSIVSRTLYSLTSHFKTLNDVFEDTKIH